MKIVLAFALLGIVLCQGVYFPDWSLSGYIGDTLYNQYGGPQSLSWDPSEQTLWALYANVSTTPAQAVLIPYTLADTPVRQPAPFPINEEGSESVFPFTYNSGLRIELPLSITNATTGIRSLTFNSANNFVLVGSRADPDSNLGLEGYFDTTCDGIVWTLNNVGESILGPVEAVFPLTCELNGITYVSESDSYFVTDPSSGALYETIITCCREIQPPTPPENRWLQQLTLRRGVGLQYGLRGENNIYTRDVSSPYSTLAAPGLGSPQDVAFDKHTNHLWVVNNFPTTTVLELTTDYVVVNHFNLETVTGGLRNASSIAVNKDWIIVSFATEGYVVVLDKPQPGSSETGVRELALARRQTPEEKKLAAEHNRLAQLQALAEKATKSATKESAPAKKNNKSGRKSHFH